MDYKVTANYSRGAEQMCSAYMLNDYPGEGGTDDYKLYLTFSKSEGYVAHNSYNFGNFLWGAGMNELGFNFGDAVIAAHWNNYYHDPISRGQLDSPDDQYSIKCGYKWVDDHSKFSSIRYFIRNSSADKDFERGNRIARKIWGK